MLCHCQIVPPKETIPSTSQCHTKAQRALSNRTRSSELHPLRLFRHPHPALARTKMSCHPVQPNRSDESLSVYLFDVLLDSYCWQLVITERQSNHYKRKGFAKQGTLTLEHILGFKRHNSGRLSTSWVQTSVETLAAFASIFKHTQ